MVKYLLVSKNKNLEIHPYIIDQVGHIDIIKWVIISNRYDVKYDFLIVIENWCRNIRRNIINFTKNFLINTF